MAEPLTRDGETVPDYLTRMLRRSIRKGEDRSCGLRSTREIAEFFGVSGNLARQRLKELLARNVVVEFAGANGSGSLWTVAGWRAVELHGND